MGAGMREVTGAILLAGMLVAAAIWFKPEPPEFAIAGVQGFLFRVNVRTGETVYCDDRECHLVASAASVGQKQAPALKSKQ